MKKEQKEIYQTVKVGKNTVPFIERGSGNHTIVDIHGFGVAAYIGLPRADALVEQGFRVIMPEMYGRNKFTLQPTTFEEYADITSGFLDTLKQGTYHLTGFSVGAGVGYHLLDKDARARTFTALSPIWPIENNLPWLVNLGILMKNLGGTMGKAKKEGRIASLNKYLDEKYVQEGLVQESERDFWKNIVRKPVKSTMFGKSISNFVFPQKIEKPVYVIAGTQDALYPGIKERYNGAKKNLPNSHLKEMQLQDHAWPLFPENTDGFYQMAAEISQFIRSA